MYRVEIEVEFMSDNNPRFDYEDYDEASDITQKIADQGYVARVSWIKDVEDGEE